MENWRAYVNEQEEEIGAAPQEPKKGVFKKLGMYIAQKFGTLDDKAKETYCSKRFPEQLKNQGDIKTYGDLVALLKCTLEYERGKEVINYIAQFIPGVAAAKEAFEQSKEVAGFVLAMYQTPDDQKVPGNLGKLDMDDHVADIIEDRVENAFVKDLIQVIQQKENLDDDIPPNWEVTDALKDFLQRKYDKRTITGFEKEG